VVEGVVVLVVDVVDDVAVVVVVTSDVDDFGCCAL
jgi:hypothetical protein